MSPERRAPDQAERDRAVAARGVNLLVDAGAGTGKTTLLVDRLVGLVAPADGSPGVPLSRIAAVTFTRKAAGELGLRVRERLLAELARGPPPGRRDLLARALADADTAFLGTIHGFADRLLRRFPVEARLSPSYQVVEDAGPLHRETFDLLLRAAEAGRLPEELAGASCTREQADEAQEALRGALAAEIRVESSEGTWQARHGLDALLRGFLLQRDVPPPDRPPAPFDLAELRAAVEAFLDRARASRGTGRGSRFLAAAAAHLGRTATLHDPLEIHREIGRLVSRAPRGGDLRMKRDFPGDRAGWEAWKAWRGDGGEALRDRIQRPLHRFLATRLVRAFPAVTAAYEKVKARRRALDELDLLVKLRDLLRGDLAVRGEMQRLLDHVFVDEFQDTDPLQAEIVLYLCEASPRAAAWREVALAPGKLTLVGDPKQSIFRFRRADVAVYQAVREIVARGPHLVASLTASFRTEPALLDHLNARMDAILGTAPPGAAAFDAEAGTVANERLGKGREGTRQACVAVLPFSTAAGSAAADRAREAEVLAAWIRRAAGGGAGGETVVDPAGGGPRPARYGDVAVLAHSTVNVPLLLAALDRLGIPWSARGGTLFLDDPLHRRFLLALRAVADRDDGVAQAALLAAPFFALDHRDLAAERAARGGPAARAGDAGAGAADGAERARAAREVVLDLRRRRLRRPPGETARDLLERTGLARAVALGPNGAQRLERLRELCAELERLAAAEGLDYDGATARLRAWALEPVPLDPPRPVGGEAVQILTVHQAKGLEFPIAVWWDARATLATRDRTAQWFVERTGSAWAMSLDGLEWEEPEGGGLLGREGRYAAAERRRLVYVAATRARDLLVLPRAGEPDPDYVPDALVGDARSAAVRVHEAWT
ncbi:MAG TPA: UvrD-helicase domain-containing protein, partial [Anaeromyxobacteraceae bacterium]|nr:UvrD-helicase domain-containing protein [Anaeromyxobacteraceae bacterium]